MFPPNTKVQVSGRYLDPAAGGHSERSWTGRVIHAYDYGGGLVYTVQPDKDLLAVEVRAEHVKAIK